MNKFTDTDYRILNANVARRKELLGAEDEFNQKQVLNSLSDEDKSTYLQLMERHHREQQDLNQALERRGNTERALTMAMLAPINVPILLINIVRGIMKKPLIGYATGDPIEYQADQVQAEVDLLSFMDKKNAEFVEKKKEQRKEFRAELNASLANSSNNNVPIMAYKTSPKDFKNVVKKLCNGEEMTNDDWAKLTRDHQDFLMNCEDPDLRRLIDMNSVDIGNFLSGKMELDFGPSTRNKNSQSQKVVNDVEYNQKVALSTP